MRSVAGILFLLLALAATLFSLVGIHSAMYEREYVSFLRYVNILAVGPLWMISICLLNRSPKAAFAIGATVAICIAGGLSILQTNASFPAKQWASERECVNHMKQIGWALHQYEQHYGCLPPAYIPDAKGKPMHSWRVLILPFLERGEGIYQKYSFKEPWNGPNNRKLVNEWPAKFYQCPVADSEPGNTNYLVVVGAGTAWPGAKSVQMKDIRDTPEKTLLFVEVADSGINWMEPRDLSFDHMSFHVNGGVSNSISSYHRGGAMVIFADGGAMIMTNTIRPEMIRAMLTIAGGESLPEGFR